MVGTQPLKSSTSLLAEIDDVESSKQVLKKVSSGKKNKQRRKRKPGISNKAVEGRNDNQVATLQTELKVEEDQKLEASNQPDEASKDTNVEEEGGRVQDIIRNLLHQLTLVEKDVVPEDEASQNKQEQEDEVVVLEAIYGSSFKVLSNQDSDDSRQFFMVEVPLEVGERLVVFMRSSSSSSSGESHYNSFTVEHLPPINLAFTFPTTYPSRSPPVFVLESTWLEAEKLASLCDKLSQRWEEMKGEVAVHSWTEFLHTQALASIEVSTSIALDYHAFQDSRVVCGATSPESTAVSMLTYNEDMQLKAFLDSTHTCEICFSEYVGKDFIQLPCTHAYCRGCLREYSSIHVKEGSVNRLKCPDVECASSIPPFVLKELLNKEEFERWETMSLEKMEGVSYCPRCETLCMMDEQHFGQCEKCFYTFCDICRQAWHVGECLSPEARLKLLESGKGATTKEEARKRADMVNQLKNLDYVTRNSKPCPSCSMAISKTAGCNKMSCSNCGKKFCYKCGVQIEGYDHFREGGPCNLFAEEDVLNWEQNNALFLLNAQNHVGEMALFPQRVRTCPSCRQRNLKTSNNNHIFCVFCRFHYCGVCLNPVKKPTEHFGINKCRQHTPD